MTTRKNLKVKTSLKAGGIGKLATNHASAGLKVRAGLKAGRILRNHNRVAL
jgi:hypothetical protein